MICKRVIGPKGQVVIPKDIRDALGLREGSEVVIEMKGDEVVLRRAKPEYEEESFTDYFTRTHSPKLNEPINIKKLIEEEVGARCHTSTQTS
ncbi:MAG: AbrB/MazE/SpoVT family DNA-binding domain-containing protein [Candidatus Jordarchaeum sp.]|uniref:AbrB/MazE/SpoVT family DNA-binding domain-containing protein n=1 Tax=Candidatus Jordarchaeum sp. TaxID=2823881 RepID=UPI00404B1492